MAGGKVLIDSGDSLVSTRRGTEYLDEFLGGQGCYALSTCLYIYLQRRSEALLAPTGRIQ